MTDMREIIQFKYQAMKLVLVTLFVFSLFLFFACNNSKKTSRKAIPKNQIWGIDISHHQRTINWSQLSKEKPHFIFLKATEGVTHKDTRYQYHRIKADQHSIITGAYHFFNFYSDGKLQAEHFCSVAKIKKGDLPPVLDVEIGNHKMPERKKVTTEILKFLKQVEKFSGVKPIIYCNYRFYLTYLKYYLPADYGFWICDYYTKPKCDWLFWQKTDKHRVAGIKGCVDLNYFKGDRNDLASILIK